MEDTTAHAVARELQLARPGRRAVSFHGKSMWPFLDEGDDVVVEPVTWEAIRPGDVITCRLDDRFPTYRVVRKRHGRLTLRGDNWPQARFTAWPEDVLGRAVARRRGDRTLSVEEREWRMRATIALGRYWKEAVLGRARTEVAAFRRTVRRAAISVAGRADQPDALHVNVSAVCNLACPMCGYLGVHHNVDFARLMSEDTFRTLLPALARVPAMHITGSGEPLTNRNLVRFLRLAREVNPSLDIDLTTNGTLLTERIIRDLIAVPLDRLVVSIDGARPETVAARRVGIDLAGVLRNVELVSQLKRELGSRKPILRINYAVGYGSYHELPEFVRMAQPLGVEEVNLLEVYAGTEESFRENLSNSLRADGGETLRRAIRLAEAASIRIMLQLDRQRSCDSPRTPHVAENGDVSPCCFLDYQGRSFYTGDRAVSVGPLAFGNVARTSLLHIWRSAPYRTLRERDVRGDFPDDCDTCYRARRPTTDALVDTLRIE